MARLPTAKELDLFDYEVPEGMALSVFPYAQEYMEDPFWYDPGGRNPFHRKRIHKMTAGEERKRKVAEVLKEFPRYGPKMYEWAIEQDDPALLKELLQSGASLDIKEAKRKRKRTKLDDGGNEETVDEDSDEIDENDPYPTVNMQPALQIAAFDGRLECVKVLVEEGGIDINAKDDNDATALTNALVQGHEDVVEWLLDHDCHIKFDGEGITDLQAALRSSKVALVKKVLEHPESTRRKLRIDAQHLAHAAWSSGDPLETVKFVLKCDCFSSPTTRAQKEAAARSLPFVISAASIESVRLMLPFITTKKEDGTFEHVELAEADLAKVFNATEDAMTKQDIPELFELVWETLLCGSIALLDAQSEPTIRKQDRLHRRLISACAEGCIETCKLIVDKYDADIHHVSHKFSSTPLGRATGSTANSLERRLPVARYLLEEKHANIHLADGEFANSASPLASILKNGARGQDAMIKLLLKNGGPLEEMKEEVLKEVKEAEASATLKFHLVLHENPRDPVRLLTHEQLEKDDTDGKPTKVEVQASKEEWSAWLESMQIRKSDEELAAQDPKGRALG